MRIKALLTSILLGTTAIAGVASADPIVRDHRAQPAYQRPVSQKPVYQRPVYQKLVNRRAIDHRPVYQQPAAPAYGFQVGADGLSVTAYAYGQDPWVEHAPRSGWVTLSSQTQLASNGIKTIAGNGQRYRVLELQSQWARVNVDLVRVVLEDGRVIDVRPNRVLDRHSPNLRVDLGDAANCGIRRVAVYGSGAGSFRLIGA